MIKDYLSGIIAAVVLGSHAVQAAAIPPPPPAQSGSEVGTYHCGAQSVVVTKTWDFKLNPQRSYVVRIDGNPLSHVDAQRLNREMEARGPFQAVSVYCVDGAPYELVLHRYTPTAERLHVYFKGTAVSDIR